MCIKEKIVVSLYSLGRAVGYDFFFLNSLYRPGVTQRMGRGIALLFHDRGTRRG